MATKGTRDKGAVKGTGRRGTDWGKGENELGKGVEEKDEAGMGSERGQSCDKAEIEGVSKPEEGGKETGRSWDEEEEEIEDVEALRSEEVRHEAAHPSIPLTLTVSFYSQFLH